MDAVDFYLYTAAAVIVKTVLHSLQNFYSEEAHDAQNILLLHWDCHTNCPHTLGLIINRIIVL